VATGLGNQLSRLTEWPKPKPKHTGESRCVQTGERENALSACERAKPPNETKLSRAASRSTRGCGLNGFGHVKTGEYAGSLSAAAIG